MSFKTKLEENVYYSALPIEYEVRTLYGFDKRKIFVIAPCYLHDIHITNEQNQPKVEYEVVFLWNKDEKTVTPKFNAESNLINGQKVDYIFKDILQCDSYVKVLNLHEFHDYKHSVEYLKKARDTLQNYQLKALPHIPTDDLRALLNTRNLAKDFEFRKLDLQRALNEQYKQY